MAFLQGTYNIDGININNAIINVSDFTKDDSGEFLKFKIIITNSVDNTIIIKCNTVMIEYKISNSYEDNEILALQSSSCIFMPDGIIINR